MLATAALLVLWPVMSAVALTVRIKLGSPILFRQVRIGRWGRRFTILKFRTMSEAYSAGGRHLPDDERLTPFGRLLRSTSLDELPELWNVIRGDMSMVGPRPLLPQYVPRYTPRQQRRHEVKPGITGWAQIQGRNVIAWEEKFELDVWYVDHRSIWLDIRILLRRSGACFAARASANQDAPLCRSFSAQRTGDMPMKLRAWRPLRILRFSGGTGEPREPSLWHRYLLHTTICPTSEQFSASGGGTLHPWDPKNGGFIGMVEWTRFTRGEPVHYMAAFCLDSAHPEMPQRALRYLAINSECMSLATGATSLTHDQVRPTRAVPLVSPGSQRIVCPMCGDAILSAVPMHRIRRQQVDHAPLDLDVPNDEQPRVPLCRAGVSAGRQNLAIGDGGSGRGCIPGPPRRSGFPAW